MSVAEISQLHGRYVRLSDKFKAIWTYNQFAAGVYKNFLQLPVPYKVNFQQIYDEIRNVCDVIQSSSPMAASPTMDKCEKELQYVVRQLIEADTPIGASVLRRFFEKLRRQDEKIVFNLIKFYLYADAVEGDARDKIDFLFTMLAEVYVEERGEFAVKDGLEMRQAFQSLVSIRPVPALSQHELTEMIREIRGTREEILRAPTFEALGQQNLLARARDLKHSIADAYFHPEILLAIIECNIATKNRFAMLYRDEEQRILEDARRLLDNEQAIARGFGDSNPELLGEMERFKQFKQEFDDSRANSNIKHNTIAQLKTSMNNILSQLDRGLNESEPEDISETLFIEVQLEQELENQFGVDPLLQPHLLHMLAIFESFDLDATQDKLARALETKNLRLEPWEAGAFQKLFWSRAHGAGETDEVLRHFLRAAALRMKIDTEAKELTSLAPSTPADPELLSRVEATLDRAKELDAQFRDMLQDSVVQSNAKLLHRLYRSRLRLLRGFSGLWLIYDQHVGAD
jgi:hypothetical protein